MKSNFDARKVIFILLFLISSLASIIMTPNVRMSDKRSVNLNDIIPVQFSNWSMVDEELPIIQNPELEKSVKSIYSSVLNRTYINNFGNKIMLSIAYTKDQSDSSGYQSHKPEICYPAQGLYISNISKSDIHVGKFKIPVRKMIATAQGRIEPITYWTTIGDTAVNDGFSMKIAQIKYGLSRVIPDGLIFRVSEINDSLDESYRLQVDFINKLQLSIGDNQKKLLGFTKSSIDE